MTYCLVADGSDVIRKIARRILESLELEVNEAADADAVLSCCRERMPDAILIDAHMRGASGADLIATLRGMPDGDRPAVIYCTTTNDANDIAKAIRLGANGHLMKPFDRASLVQKLNGLELVAS